MRFGTDNIANTLNLFDANGAIDYSRISFFSVADYAFFASYARKMSWLPGLRVGGSVKVIYRNVGSFANGWGFGFDIGAQLIAPFLWQHYVRHFDLMALTHMHPDHARGLVSILRLFPAQHLLTNGSSITSDYVRDLFAAGQRWGTQHHTAQDGPRDWQWERLQLRVLAPPDLAERQHSAWTPRNENDRSLVLRLQYGAVRLLLTGDIEQATERWLLAQGADLRADILKVPHHGSKTSTSLAFVQQVQPRLGIISTGANNPFGHPHPQVLDVLAHQGVEVWRTDEHGAITITSDGTGYQVSAVRPYRPVLPWRSQETARQAFSQEGS